MGVPAFFRWLSRKYPSIVVHAVERKPVDVNGDKIPVDTTAPNPNDIEFDNLYLDMNGIIHPCCHPENKPAPKNEDEMMIAIFEYIDRLFAIVRPRKLLYMAIDGVAPRAKMNQQRSRRFRAAKESKEGIEEIARIREELRQKGANLPPEKEKGEHFDSNCITPGTPFMDRLSKCLQYYIVDRLNSDPGWKGIKVILSDANAPGEGEHKIMDFIRKQRAQPDHDPNTKHCLNGADADLIMLGLATHEPNFTIIREEFKFKPRPCSICGQVGHEQADCQGLPKEIEGEHDELSKPVGEEVEFIFIRLPVLREYLERELRMDGLPFPYSFERSLDDWVFMCFFVGNDFLPHLPSLEIREGAIDRLVNLYKRCLTRTGGYITENGYVNLQRVQFILKELGEVEDEIFKRRQEKELKFRERKRAEKRAKMEHDLSNLSPLMGQFQSSRHGGGGNPWSRREDSRGSKFSNVDSSNQKAAVDLRAMLRSPSSEQDKSDNSEAGQQGTKRKLEEEKKTEEKKDDDDDVPEDNIRLWEDGWKDRYYSHKFNISSDEDGFESLNKFRRDVAWAYVRGLCWVLRYYYQGCPSWKWYFPYHYAPFASDFVDILNADCNFEKNTQPFKPLEQLMGVFPAASGQHIPPTWRDLMSSPESPILDFYPEDFKIDLNGKKYAWQGVALLPFVDEKRLLSALEPVYPDLTEEEVRRNRKDINLLFCGRLNPMYDFLVGLYEGDMLKEKQELVTSCSQGQKGTVLANPTVALPRETMPPPIRGLPPIKDQMTISVKYEDPSYEEDFVFPAHLLPNATIQPKVLKPEDFPQNQRYTPQTGFNRNSHNPYRVSTGGFRMIAHNQESPQRFHRPGSYQSNNQRQQNSWSSYGRNNYDQRPSYDQRSSYNNPRQPTPYNQRGGQYQQQSYGQQGQYQPYNQQQQYQPFNQQTSYQNNRYDYNQRDNRRDNYANNSSNYRQSYHGNRNDGMQSRDYNSSSDRQRDSRQQDPRKHSFPTSQNRYHPY
eukprot:gene17453-19198_t